MKYIDYLTNAAQQSATFAGDAIESAFNYIGELPETSAQVAAIAGDYFETAFNYVGELPETSAQIAAIAGDYVGKIPNISYEAIQALLNAASMTAESLGNILENSPSYLSTLAASAADYSIAAIAAANNYLNNAENEECPIDWMQIQDDGVYFFGDGGTSGVAGASGDWEVLPRPKYPENVPVVPPQIIPTGKKKVRKLRPPEGDPKGCVNKRDPKIGEIVTIQTTNPVSDVFWVLYWDNIGFITESKSFGSQTVYDNYLKGTPAAMPLFTDIVKFANLAPGRYVIESVNHNEGVIPMGLLSEFYDTVERWMWQYVPYLGYNGELDWENAVEESHGNEYHECLSIEFGDYSGMYFYPSKRINGDWAGGGSATSYTLGRIQIRYQGIFPPVSEDKHAGAYLAIHQVNTFNILTSMLCLREII